MALPDLFTDPVAMAALVIVLAVIGHVQQGFTWTEYATIHRVKRRLFPLADRVWPRFVHEKGRTEDAEYVCTVDQRPRSVWKQLVSEGASPHVLSSLKRRPGSPSAGQTAPPEYSAAHVRWQHGDGYQSEAYCFRNSNGSTDVYAHYEPAVTRVRAHLDGSNQRDGDVTGVVRAALGRKPEQ